MERVSISNTEDGIVVTLGCAYLDMITGSDVSAQVKPYLDGRWPTVYIDLAEVMQINWAGIATLSHLAQIGKSNQCEVILVPRSREVNFAFTLQKLNASFHTTDRLPGEPVPTLP